MLLLSMASEEHSAKEQSLKLFSEYVACMPITPVPKTNTECTNLSTLTLALQPSGHFWFTVLTVQGPYNT